MQEVVKKEKESPSNIARTLKFLKRNAAPIIFAIFVLTLPIYANAVRNVIKIDIIWTMRAVGIFSIVTVGLNMLMGYAGQISLGHSAFFGIGAYTTAILTVKADFPVMITLFIAILMAGLVGFVVGAPILKLKGHYLAMATLGLGIIGFICFRELTWLTGGNDGINGIPPLNFIFTARTTTSQYLVIWFFALIVLLLTQNIVRSRIGRSFKAIHSSEVAAASMGMNVSLMKTKAFVLSAAYAGLAGALFAHIQGGFIGPGSFDISLSVLLLTMTVIGGMESVWGAVAGSALLTFLPEVVKALPRWFKDVPYWISNYSNYEMLIFGLVLTLTMIFMPEGITKGIKEALRKRKMTAK